MKKETKTGIPLTSTIPRQYPCVRTMRDGLRKHYHTKTIQSIPFPPKCFIKAQGKKPKRS